MSSGGGAAVCLFAYECDAVLLCARTFCIVLLVLYFSVVLTLVLLWFRQSGHVDFIANIIIIMFVIVIIVITFTYLSLRHLVLVALVLLQICWGCQRGGGGERA